MKLFNHIFILFLLMSTSLASAQFSDIARPYATQIWAYENQGDKLLLADKGDSFQLVDNQAVLRWVDETGTLASSQKFRTIIGEDSFFRVKGVTQVGQTVYMMYSVYSLGSNVHRLASYDTSTQIWTRINNANNYLLGGQNVDLTQIKYFDGLVYLGGSFYSGPDNMLLSYTITGDSISNVFNCDSIINQIQIFDNELYVSGLFRQISSSGNIGGLISFQNSTTWTDVILNDSNSDGYQYYTRVDANFDATYYFGSSVLNLFSKDGSNPANIAANLTLVNIDEIQSLVKFDDKLWVTSISDNGVLIYNAANSQWTNIASNLSGQAKLEKIKDKLLLIELNTTSSIQRFTRFGPVVKGNVYLDLNKNCIRDSGEPGLAGKTVFEKSGKWAGITDINGEFSLLVDTGLYYMDTLYGLFNLRKVICSSSDSLEVDGAQDTVYYHAGYSEIVPNQSVKLQVNSTNGFRARQGFTEVFELVLHNQGITSNNCEYTIRIPEDFHIISFGPTINDSLNKAYKFNYPLAIGEKKTIELRVLVPVNTPSLQTRKLFFYADSACLTVPGDSLILTVRGAYDPNDKQSSEPSLMNKDTRLLKYHIRFQNTGTDTAYRVTIIDTIDRDLPINYIEIRDASHPYKIDVLHEAGSQYYALKFTFDNILLPDSNTNEEGSHGYIQYETSIRNTFGQNDTIFNQAHIFFDYQSAIITNYVQNSWDTTGNGNSIGPRQKLDDLVIIYPNPSSDELTILNDLYRPINFTISDAQGKIIGYSYVGPKGKSSFITSELPAGIYYLQSPDRLIRKRFIVMHSH